LVPVLFPEAPVLALLDPLTSADDNAIMILANGGRVSEISSEHATLAALRESLARVLSKVSELLKPGIRAPWNVDRRARTTSGVAETGEYPQP
ncbi:hypothetical protein, partial [Cupriavidus sp. M-11]|uniref:hypothetical protein n=1 Tax=Cupriavidus sp. M-11 TaxID=3233038 RepID=UPI003F8EFD58